VKLALCIPTLNALGTAPALIAALRRQTRVPDEVLVIDSESDDGSLQLFESVGARVYSISRAEFNHGGTRQLAVDMLVDAEVVVFLTQDAILADCHAIEKIVDCFADPDVAAAYGRQLPRHCAGPVEAHARLFNYPSRSRTNSLSDAEEIGLKTVFISNSFSAYRRNDLMAVGGFPSHLILGEDTYIAAKLLLAERKIAYCAEALVYHSHNYKILEEFRRYFDTGVLHAREPWIRQRFGNAEGDGLRYVKSELVYLWARGRSHIPSALFRNAWKLIGFRLGLKEALLPQVMKRKLSMFRSYWAN